MVAGYLRIYNKKIKRYVTLDGVPGNNKDTHFKILKREEMLKMRFFLIRDLSDLDFYGYIPETINASEKQIESFELDEKDEDPLDKDFINPVNDLCHSPIDLMDVDYLNSAQCKLLPGWLQQRLTQSIEPRLRTIYTVLIRFAKAAIDLQTGIVFDL